jgi:hypothetical protein
LKRTLTFVLMLVVLAGCRRAVGGPEPGALGSPLAVQGFLNAAKAGDLQAMSAMFGNDISPLRDRETRQSVERRMMIMVCHLKHDTVKIGPAQAGQNGRTQHRVELTQGTKSASPMFTTVKNVRTGRWFVEEFDIAAVREMCTSPTGASDGQAAASAR